MCYTAEYFKVVSSLKRIFLCAVALILILPGKSIHLVPPIIIQPGLSGCDWFQPWKNYTLKKY